MASRGFPYLAVANLKYKSPHKQVSRLGIHTFPIEVVILITGTLVGTDWERILWRRDRNDRE